VGQISGWGWTVIAALGGLVLGAFLSSWLARRAARAQKRIPRHWPLNPRVVVNSEERKVWRWLSRVFFDHHVMVKMPVTRYTMPRDHEEGQHWYKLLAGVYCTFTICSPEGRVIGCVDVPGAHGLSRGNRHLKQTLLSQCGIAYWVVQPSALPTLAEIRTEFLGELASFSNDRERDEAMIAAARLSLRSTIERQRHNRDSDLAPLGEASGHASSAPASFGLDSRATLESDGSSWHQENSFLSPLDSRCADLPPPGPAPKRPVSGRARRK
jgi:hypothetical protein